jgi:serine/threonine-protein kinase HipA
MPALAVERFDRDPEGTPIAMEGLYALMAAGARDITAHYGVDLERVGRALDTPGLALPADRRALKLHLLKRLLLALLTGNGDLHLENLALLDSGEQARFSPVYDPTPMRAYQRHNILTPLSFGGYGESTADVYAACVQFGRSLGFRKDTTGRLAGELLALTADYAERVRALEAVPEACRALLVAETDRVRRQFERGSRDSG